MAPESVFSADHCEQGDLMDEGNTGQNEVGYQYVSLLFPLTLFTKYFGFWNMSRIRVLAPLNYVFLDINIPSSLCQN